MAPDDPPHTYPWKATCDACGKQRSAEFLSTVVRPDPYPPWRYCRDEVECIEIADIIRRLPPDELPVQ